MGVLTAAPDLTSFTPQKVFTFRRSLRGLSRQHSTNSGDSSRFRSTISNIFGRNNDDPRDCEIGTTVLTTSDPNLLRGLSSKRVKFIKTHLDFAPPERRAWECAQLQEQVNFLDILVNPAPVQLVEKTPLSEVHSLFSMVGIYQAYVTNIGRLVGVVGLSELKRTIDDVNSGDIEKYFLDDIQSDLVEAETPLLERLDRIQLEVEGEELPDDEDDDEKSNLKAGEELNGNIIRRETSSGFGTFV